MQAKEVSAKGFVAYGKALASNYQRDDESREKLRFYHTLVLQNTSNLFGFHSLQGWFPMKLGRLWLKGGL